jgi:glycosyltransferase involved in cell wall biosynthesis
MGNIKSLEFSILVTGFNDAKNYENFFENIEKQSLHPCELVIADGGSSDNSEALIASVAANYSFDIRYVPTRDRLNIAQGYNVAVKESRTEAMLIMGIGNQYSLGFCESMVRYYLEHNVHIVYSPIVGVEKNQFSKAFNAAFVGGKKGKNFGYASNRGVFLTKKVFEKIGYFYENFVYAGEDTEFFIRAEKAGMRSGYNTNGAVYWETPASFQEYLKKNKVNAIADMQLANNMQIYKHICIRFALIAATIISGLVLPWIPLLLWLVIICLIAYKISSFNLMAIALRIHFIFLPSYYYIRERKYMENMYKFKL